MTKTPRESSHSIGEWANCTFGPVQDPISSVTRANEEMAELLSKCAKYPDLHNHVESIVKEAADIVICLHRFANHFGQDLYQHVDEKMLVNYGRKWEPDGTGHGYHVK